MPKLDTMLRAVADKGARELRLSDGQRPVFRFPDGDRPVSQTALNRAQIVTLISELSGPEGAAKLQAGEAVQFVYQLSDGAAFECEVRARNGALEARLVPRAAAAGQAALETAVPSAATPTGTTAPFASASVSRAVSRPRGRRSS